jgi:hypothetical protein
MDVLAEVKKEIALIEKKEGFGNHSEVQLYANLMYLRGCLEKESKTTGWDITEEVEETIEKISNKTFDRNINALYDTYIEARKMYDREADYAHKEKLMDALDKLMVEIYDLICTIHMSAVFAEERDLIGGFIQKMNGL